LIAALVASVAATATLAACSGGGLDVVGQQSTTSFEAVLQAIPDQVEADTANGGWSLAAPDCSARFIWSLDYSQSPLHDVMLEFDAEPFLNAGLDLTKLPANFAFYGDMLMVGTKLGDSQFTYDGDATALASYGQIVKNYRDTINYHSTLDHFGVKLGDGNMFEWAKDMATNGNDNTAQDKDIVFVLNPEPLIAAGVDPDMIDGWAYTEVPIEEKGKTTQVWKFLKPFNLK